MLKTGHGVNFGCARIMNRGIDQTMPMPAASKLPCYEPAWRPSPPPPPPPPPARFQRNLPREVSTGVPATKLGRMGRRGDHSSHEGGAVRSKNIRCLPSVRIATDPMNRRRSRDRKSDQVEEGGGRDKRGRRAVEEEARPAEKVAAGLGGRREEWEDLAPEVLSTPKQRYLDAARLAAFRAPNRTLPGHRLGPSFIELRPRVAARAGPPTPRPSDPPGHISPPPPTTAGPCHAICRLHLRSDRTPRHLNNDNTPKGSTPRTRHNRLDRKSGDADISPETPPLAPAPSAAIRSAKHREGRSGCADRLNCEIGLTM